MTYAASQRSRLRAGRSLRDSSHLSQTSEILQLLTTSSGYPGLIRIALAQVYSLPPFLQLSLDCCQFRFGMRCN
jgi:hypothetical protein